MTTRPLILALCSVPLCIACNPTEPRDSPPTVISGRYEVRGVTTGIGNAEKRKINGTVILVQEGDHYTATFELKTTLPSSGAETSADVIGIGSGAIEGTTLSGKVQTQMVVSAVPGVDTGFAFVPRTVSTRIESTSVAAFSPDGAITIELENRPAKGEHYQPTRTRLTGTRVSGTSPADLLASAN